MHLAAGLLAGFPFPQVSAHGLIRTTLIRLAQMCNLRGATSSVPGWPCTGEGMRRSALTLAGWEIPKSRVSGRMWRADDLAMGAGGP